MRPLLLRLMPSLLSILPLVILAAPLSAADAPTQAKPQDLSKMAREAKLLFKQPDPAIVEKAKADLLEATDALEQFLASGGPAKLQGWKKYLKWDAMQQAMDKKGGPDLKVLNKIIPLYFKPKVTGLELKQFVAVRKALRKYSDAVFFAASKQFRKQYEQQLDTLAKELETYAKKPTGDLGATIGSRLDYIQRTGLANDFVAAVRARFWHPNLHVVFSRDFLNMNIERKVNDSRDIEDYILRTSMHGHVHTVGKVEGELSPSSNQVAIDIRLRAIALSENVGQHGRVTIYTDGTTEIDASKRILFDQKGIRLQPAEASCETSTVVTGIGARCCLIRRLAQRSIARKKGQAEVIASQHAEERVERQLNAEVAEMTGKAAANYDKKFRQPLLRLDRFPKLFNCQTTDKAITITALQVHATQLAAPGNLPAMEKGLDASVRVHESIAANFAEGIIGGITLTDERLAEMVKNATGKVPEELRITPDKDPWSITFTKRQPASVQFRDDTIRIAIRGYRFTRGEQPPLKKRTEISATYKLKKTPNGLLLVRQGEVQVNFLRHSGFLSVRLVTYKTFLRNKMSAVFKEELGGKKSDLKGPMKKLAQLQIEQAISNKGWLTLGWKLPSKTKTANK